MEKRNHWLPFHELRKKWSIWVAFFWGGVGGVIIVGSAYLNLNWDVRVGILIVVMSASLAAARAARQPGTDQ